MTDGAHPIVIRGQTALRATRWERRVRGCLSWDAVDADEQERVFRQATCLASFIDFIDKQCGYYESEPATTIDDLTKYHSQSARAAGRKAAQTAIMYATGSSRSPMEAIVYTLFSLPHMLRGLNCGPIKPNFKITMQGNAEKLSGLPYVVTDAYLPNLNSILEYNGSYHDESSVRRRDEARTLGLMCMGIDVYRLNDL